MNYTEKLHHAEAAANQLSNNVSLEEVRTALKEKGLYDSDISNVIVSARNVMLDKLQPIIRTKLLANEPINTAVEFAKLDRETLQELAQKGRYALEMEQRNKVGEMLRNGDSQASIKQAINMDFYSQKQLDHQVRVYIETKEKGDETNIAVIIVIAVVIAIFATIVFPLNSENRGGHYIFRICLMITIWIMGREEPK